MLTGCLEPVGGFHLPLVQVTPWSVRRQKEFIAWIKFSPPPPTPKMLHNLRPSCNTGEMFEHPMKSGRKLPLNEHLQECDVDQVHDVQQKPAF